VALSNAARRGTGVHFFGCKKNLLVKAENNSFSLEKNIPPDGKACQGKE
jgi:hypothetical protein